MFALDAAKATYARDVEALKALQKDLQKCQQAKQQLNSQQNENEMVLEELKRLDDDANVYKLIGPALIKQDLVEAKSNVNKRLEYIKGELERLENQAKSLETKAQDKAAEIHRLQKKLKSLQEPGAS